MISQVLSIVKVYDSVSQFYKFWVYWVWIKGFPVFIIQFKSCIVETIGAGKFSGVPPAFALLPASSSSLGLCCLPCMVRIIIPSSRIALKIRENVHSAPNSVWHIVMLVDPWVSAAFANRYYPLGWYTSLTWSFFFQNYVT